MFRRAPYGYGRPVGYGIGGNDLLEEMLEVEAIEDLMEGDVDGFVEDEMLASIF